jgi:hypothetical protein
MLTSNNPFWGRTLLMSKTAQIFAVQSRNAHGFRWKWHSTERDQESKNTFVYYFECLQDAERAGYAVAPAPCSPPDQERRA